MAVPQYDLELFHALFALFGGGGERGEFSGDVGVVFFDTLKGAESREMKKQLPDLISVRCDVGMNKLIENVQHGPGRVVICEFELGDQIVEGLFFLLSTV